MVTEEKTISICTFNRDSAITYTTLQSNQTVI